MQVRWEKEDQKKILLQEIRKLLVPSSGEKLKITPLRQQIQIPYPTPPDFQLYWCSEKTEYRKVDLLQEALSALHEYYETAPRK